MLMTEVATQFLLFGKDTWLQNRLCADSQKVRMSVKCFVSEASDAAPPPPAEEKQLPPFSGAWVRRRILTPLKRL